MQLDEVKAFLKSGNWNKLESRVETLKTIGVAIRMQHYDKRVARCTITDEDGFPYTFHLYSMAEMRKVMNQPNNEKPYGKNHRKAFR